MNKIICPECKRVYEKEKMSEEDFRIEKEWIEEYGECLSCDHIKGEILAEYKYELRND